ncbi:hypothetical protein [Nannocystis sp. SCPEA4]|uniref:hypothetical protein n=1 Tax=Nannocystis sp. SCPEA4 TaxID=2996787 RepID=UPI00227185F6|nr:hypothetical protein [Nannocystis sp. SCPEA4]MCY1053690.1 hypothetical protein [Nannocystis sp. SCPEA4]
MSARTLLAAASLALLALAPASVRGGESSAERLHRKGVHCMEEIERRDCAIEHFEALLDERTDRRELVTDGLLRLVKLYEKEDRPEDLKAALRRFWDAGKTDTRRGHLPYTARFLPKDFDVVFHAHMQRLMAAPLAKQLDEIAEYVMTCDPHVRDQLDDVRIFRKAQRKARETGVTVQKAMSDVVAEEKKRTEAYKKRRAQAEAEGRPRRPEPVFADATCQVARALGDDTAAVWTRGAFALAHGDFTRSAAIIEIPDLAAKLEAAVAAGRLLPRGERAYALTPLRYHGGEVLLRVLDGGELVVAPPAVMNEIAANYARGKRTLPREVDRLVVGVPVDAGFFAVATEAAVRELGFGGMSKGRRGLLQLLLPRPEGLQMAGVAHEYFGFFLRMPTDTPLKAGALVEIVQRMIANQAEADSESADFLRLLDVTQATDKRALLLSYVMSRRQIETIVLR